MWFRGPLSVVAAIVVPALVPSNAGAQGTGQRYAFLVACGQYEVTELKPLKFTNADILGFRDVLIQSGFKSERMRVLHDRAVNRLFVPEVAKVRRQLELLLRQVEANDTLVVAFSGHGIQFAGDKQNYFCPLDANVGDKQTLVALGEVYRQMEACPARQKLLLVDACRNDPLADIAKAKSVAKLESVSRPQGEALPKGIVALFSCSEGERSFELPEIGHGVFFHHVIEGWKGRAAVKGVVTLDALVNHVKLQTKSFAFNRLNESQVPHVRNDFSGVWVLNPTPATFGPPGKLVVKEAPPQPVKNGPPLVDAGKDFPRDKVIWDGKIKQGVGTVHPARLTTTYDGTVVKGALEFTFTDAKGNVRRYAGNLSGTIQQGEMRFRVVERLVGNLPEGTKYQLAYNPQTKMLGGVWDLPAGVSVNEQSGPVTFTVK